MVYNETYRSFLAIVCKHLGLVNAAEAIDDFLTTDPKNREILRDLLGETGSTGMDFFAYSFGALFYKVTVSDRHVFRIPVSYGTSVLRKNHSHVPSTQGSQKSGTDAGTFTFLGVSDPVSSHRGSVPFDPLDRPTTPKTMSFRESVASSHGMTFATTSGEADLEHGLYKQNQFLCGQAHLIPSRKFVHQSYVEFREVPIQLTVSPKATLSSLLALFSNPQLVARTYPRDCLFALPLTIANNNEAFTEDRAYVYAIRCNVGPIWPRIKYSSDPMQLFPTNVSIGYLQGSMLNCAHRLFSTVYMRLLAYYTQCKEICTTTEGSDTSGSKSPSRNKSSKTGPINLATEGSMHSAEDSSTQPSIGAGSGSISSQSRHGTYAGGGGTDDSQRLRDEFSVTLFKFSTVLEETIHALQAVFNLEEPNFMPNEIYVVDPSRDYLMIPQISRLLKTWDDQIDAVLAVLDRPRPISSGPLEEVDYWRYRYKVLTAVAEALRSKTARWVMNAWIVLNPDALPYNRGAEIQAQMVEAKDNSRFLLLVERHFKNVQFGPTFDSVTDTIPAMVQSLRLIWTISRGYNKDERMGPLLRRIAWALCDRVICVLEVSHLFGQSIRYIMREVRAAIRMLTTFENTYLQERQRVEATSQDNRWEFDRKLLFGDINYMKRILTDIFDMAKDLPCPFLWKNEKAWLKVKSEFEDSVSMIDAKAKNFINDYFAHIRGPTSAFDLLEKFKSVKARAVITCLLKDKYRDVLRSYGNELVKVDLKFKESKDAPMFAHYIPPIAGSISWARLILSTVKASILRFLHSQPDILDEEEGKASVQAIFPPPAWWAGSKGETGTVLIPPPPPQAQMIRQLTAEQAIAQGIMRRTSSIHLQRHHCSAISWTSQGERGSLGTSQQIPQGCLPVYEVNFDSKLWGVVQEAARLELFGLPLPEIGRFLGLRYTYYQNMVLQLQRMVDRYEAIRVQLDPLKVSLTEKGLKNLVNTIDRGVFYLNWDSLVVDEYLEFCDQKLKRTENHVKEINRCFDVLERIGVLISQAQMFNVKGDGQLVSAKQNVVEKWLHSRTWNTNDFELRVIYLRTRWQSLDRLLGSKRIIYVGAIALRLASFFMNVTTNLRDWIRIYMRYLYESAENLFNQVQKTIMIKRKVLRKRPTSLTEMKELLSVMAEIRGGACEEVDDLLLKISERLRIIKLYADEIPAHMWDCTRTFRRRWNAILSISYGMAQNVAPFKAHFAVGIAEEIKTFRKRVRAFVESYKISGPGNESEDLDNGCISLAKFVAECELLDARRIDLLSSERLLDLSISAYPELKEMKTELQKLKPIYELYTEQKSARQDWACTLWKDAKLGDLVAAMRDFISRFRQRPRRTRALPAARMLNTTLKNFLESLLLIQNLKDDAMRDRHWKQLMEKTGISFDMDPQTFTLEGVFAMQLHEFADVISTVVNNAQREVIIERKLEEIKNIWLDMKFLLTSYTKCNKEPCYVLGSVDEPTQCMEDHMMSLQSIGASRYATPFLAIVRQWERDLTIVSDTLDLWVVVQQKWMYLEAIFMGGDVAKQLPNEAKRFETIDKMFRKIMKQTQEIQFVMKSCLTDHRLETFRLMESELDLCQKALNNYLDAKRNAFPRFYFISDDEVLNILGGKEAEIIQEHIIKMFDNIGKLKFFYSAHSSDVFVSALISFEGEVMEFTKGMVILAASQIWFTWEVEDVFRSFKQGNRRAMKEYDKKLEEQLNETVYRIRTELSANDMKKLETVLILDVHSKDMVERFIRDSIMAPDEFDWESQLRFYWVRKLDSLIIRQCSVELNYGNEYFGLNGRLVITPLTDRIYLTATQALSLCLGGAPTGPAGTGKTETIKDLAKALGLLCVVTNCGENMDYKSFAKLLSGLCRSGAWGCFDDFNRIHVSVLSVVSSQIKLIQNALQTKANIFQDLAKKMTTLYRLAKEQLSQQYHYDFGLRALRSLLVMAGVMRRKNPNLREDQLLMRALRDSNIPKLIHEDVPLFMGLIQDLFPGIEFENAPMIAELVEAAQYVLTHLQYTIVEEQVVKISQLHETLQYRHAVMVVGPTCGGKTVVIDVYVRALKAMGINTKMHIINPKDRSVNDLYGYLEPTSREWIDGLLSYLFRIMNQTTEATERRFLLFDGDVDALWVENMNSVMDDSKLLTLVNGERIRLQPYSSLLFEVADLQYASPATVSRCGMVYVDPVNLGYVPYWNSWTTEATERRFLLFDGDVDALWVENMNSVMDDSKLLTLVNGERIRLQPYSSLLFEVADLQYASPATVSRCGMVYVDPVNLGYVPYWNSWVSDTSTNVNTILNALFSKYVGVIMDYIFDGTLPTGISRLLAATATTQVGAHDRTARNSKDSEGATGKVAGVGGGLSGMGGSKDSGNSSSGLPKIKLVHPLVRMNLIVQLCTLLRSQLDIGALPGTEKIVTEGLRHVEVETYMDATKPSYPDQATSSVSASVLSTSNPVSPQPPSSSNQPHLASPPTLSQMASQGQSRESADELTMESADVLESVFIFCLCWTFTSVVSEADQCTIDNLIKALSSLPQTDEGPDGKPVKAGTLPAHYPMLTDYMFRVDKYYWVSWRSLVPIYVHDTTIPFTRILVPTVETIKLNWIVDEHLKLRYPLVVVGQTGTSKTATIESIMRSLEQDTNSRLILNFSSRTTAYDVRRMLNANVEKRAKGVYGPIPGKKLVVFIDDMNMPREDEYGTQQPIALLRVVVGRGGMYQQGSDLSWRSLRDMTYLAAIGPAGGGRRSLDPRFVSLFTVYHALPPSTDSLFTIFGSILLGHLSIGFSRKLQSFVDKFTHLSLLVY
ncbi:dynein heavy chain, axonemal, partial [Paragonimus westermani]